VVIEDANPPDNKIRVVVSPAQAKRLAETTRPTTESTIWALGITSVGPHHVNPGERFQRSNEDPGSDTDRLTHHIRQVVDPVRQVNLEAPWWTEQCRVALSKSCVAMACWLLLIVCFHLDDAAAQRTVREDLSDETPGNQRSRSFVKWPLHRLSPDCHSSPFARPDVELELTIRPRSQRPAKPRLPHIDDESDSATELTEGAQV
jgi:hypothetical protein